VCADTRQRFRAVANKADRDTIHIEMRRVVQDDGVKIWSSLTAPDHDANIVVVPLPVHAALRVCKNFRHTIQHCWAGARGARAAAECPCTSIRRQPHSRGVMAQGNVVHVIRLLCFSRNLSSS
jgi:hypothetical protein